MDEALKDQRRWKRNFWLLLGVTWIIYFTVLANSGEMPLPFDGIGFRVNSFLAGFLSAWIVIVFALIGAFLVATQLFIPPGTSEKLVLRVLGLGLHIPLVAAILVGALEIANVRFDTSEAREQEVRITRRYVTTRHSTRHGDYTDGWYLQLEPWGDSMREYLSVPPEIYDRFRDGQVLRVRIRQGWLGSAWIESMVPHD